MRNIRFVEFSCLVLGLCMEMGRFLEGVGYEAVWEIGGLGDGEKELEERSCVEENGELDVYGEREVMLTSSFYRRH
jgi:hypothetical protein